MVTKSVFGINKRLRKRVVHKMRHSRGDPVEEKERFQIFFFCFCANASPMLSFTLAKENVFVDTRLFHFAQNINLGMGVVIDQQHE